MRWLDGQVRSQGQSNSRSANISFDYQYEGNRLRKCIITTDKGVIEETVELDDLGRIVKLSRNRSTGKACLGIEG
jgi:hypothetical protein